MAEYGVHCKDQALRIGFGIVQMQSHLFVYVLKCHEPNRGDRPFVSCCKLQKLRYIFLCELWHTPNHTHLFDCNVHQCHVHRTPSSHTHAQVDRLHVEQLLKPLRFVLLNHRVYHDVHAIIYLLQQRVVANSKHYVFSFLFLKAFQTPKVATLFLINLIEASLQDLSNFKFPPVAGTERSWSLDLAEFAVVRNVVPVKPNHRHVVAAVFCEARRDCVWP
mmetsp:Transcript_20920/g.37270  ORF Transcript_20920/g.37270 Transcript_20920/m.37270 type:complete len:219 (-) Transcript_20920:434-1090(-)